MHTSVREGTHHSAAGSAKEHLGGGDHDALPVGDGGADAAREAGVDGGGVQLGEPLVRHPALVHLRSR